MPIPALLTVRVQVKGVPRTATLLVLLALLIVRSGAATTVLLSVLDVTPPTVADAVLVTRPAETSPVVTV